MQFYVLNRSPTGQDEAARTDALQAAGTRRGSAPCCEACGNYIGMRQWLPPYRVELHSWGREFGDLTFPTASDLLVSLRFKELWERQGLIGLSDFEPVDVVKVTRHRKLVGEPPTYFKAAVVLGQAVVDSVASGVELEEPPTCPICRLGNGIKSWKALVIEPETWSGEDIFRPRWAADFLATSRFKNFCEANEMKNAVFIPAEEYGHNFCS
jgi:hypothetical protein